MGIKGRKNARIINPNLVCNFSRSIARPRIVSCLNSALLLNSKLLLPLVLFAELVNNIKVYYFFYFNL